MSHPVCRSADRHLADPRKRVVGLLGVIALMIAAGALTLIRPQRPSMVAVTPIVLDNVADRLPEAMAASSIEPLSADAVDTLRAAFERQRLAAIPAAALPSRPTAITDLVAFDAAPFPYAGDVPGKGRFLDVQANGREGHRRASGQILWQDETFADRHVLLHIPARFDPDKAGAIVVFFHGHGATLPRDVRDRQQVAEQVSQSGANAVLVAPQFAVDARDSSAGAFWESGGFTRFLDEAARRMAQARGDSTLASRFGSMPVVLVAYSGGYLPAAWGLKDIAATKRVRGVVLLDALYGELDVYADWAASNRDAFLVSAHTRSTKRVNGELEKRLTAAGIRVAHDLPDDLTQSGVTILATPPEANHTDYVTRAWTQRPLADLLARLPAFRRDGPVALVREGDGTRRHSAEVTLP